MTQWKDAKANGFYILVCTKNCGVVVAKGVNWKVREMLKIESMEKVQSIKCVQLHTPVRPYTIYVPSLYTIVISMK